MLLVLSACEHRTLIPGLDANLPDGAIFLFPDAGTDGGVDAGMDAGPPVIPDAGPLSPDAACSSATQRAEVERVPVDIIWVVDNSASMEPAIVQVQAGLNDFAALIGGRMLDYRVIMLSLRGRGEIERHGSTHYQVCIPEPLAGDADCGDGARFFQVEVDIHSQQPIEQFLGTLGQTTGYLDGDQYGSAPWAHLLRPEATKSIVVVTDDNARMVIRNGSGYEKPDNIGRVTGDPVATADWFETKPAAPHPYTTSRYLPEGILHARWAGLFDGYVFHALYGWGSETDPLVICDFPGSEEDPDAAGLTYTELVQRTGGVRAQICDGADAWGPFFDAVATAVERTSRIDCTVAIPEPPEELEFRRDRINVLVDDGSGAQSVGKVSDEAACDERGGWYYDDEASPENVILCPVTCDAVQPTAGASTAIDVQFGCQTILI